MTGLGIEAGDRFRADSLRSYERFCTALVAEGVFAHRYPLGRWFVSTAHDDAVIDETLVAVRAALDAVV
jgi:glutamate-1-semialdehyde aminotransferase